MKEKILAKIYETCPELNETHECSCPSRKSHDFYAKFANMPLDQREKFFTEGEYKGLTPNDIYNEVKYKEHIIRRYQTELEQLLVFSEKFL